MVNYKTRLVIKCHKTSRKSWPLMYSSVTRITSIIMIISFATLHNLEIRHKDVNLFSLIDILTKSMLNNPVFVLRLGKKGKYVSWSYRFMISTKGHDNGLRKLTPLKCQLDLRSMSLKNEYTLNMVIWFRIYMLMAYLLWVIMISCSNIHDILNGGLDM